VTCTIYPDGKKNPEAMTYYKSSHGHNNSVINGIGRIGKQFGGKSALWDDETMADEFVKQARKYITARKKDQPFFLFWSAADIHVPRAPNPRFKGVSKLSYLCSTSWGSLRREVQTSSQAAHSRGSTC